MYEIYYTPRGGGGAAGGDMFTFCAACLPRNMAGCTRFQVALERQAAVIAHSVFPAEARGTMIRIFICDCEAGDRAPHSGELAYAVARHLADRGETVVRPPARTSTVVDR